MFIIIISSVCFILSVYTALRLFKGLGLSDGFVISGRILVILTGFAYPLVFIFRRQGHGSDLYTFFYWYENFAVGLLSIFCAILLFRDLLLIINFFVKKLSLEKKREKNTDDYQKGRRDFLFSALGGGLLSAGGMAAGYGLYEALKVPEVKKEEIFVKGLSKDLDGFRIVQITDLHITFRGKGRWLSEVVKKVNDLSPHIFALTGDIADKPASIIKDEFISLRDVKSSYGSFYVTGNHEYYSGVQGWIDAMEELGLKALMNENKRITHGKAGVIVAGVPDLSTHRRRDVKVKSFPEKAIKGAGIEDFKILLAHQPKSIYAASKAGFDLQISGHTHGGQFFPWRWLVRKSQPFFAGLYKHKNTQIYVSRGTGFWGPPLRIGAPSEITLLTLRSV